MEIFKSSATGFDTKPDGKEQTEPSRKSKTEAQEKAQPTSKRIESHTKRADDDAAALQRKLDTIEASRLKAERIAKTSNQNADIAAELTANLFPGGVMVQHSPTETRAKGSAPVTAVEAPRKESNEARAKGAVSETPAAQIAAEGAQKRGPTA